LPKKGDPLQLDQFFTEVRNLLDECYRRTTAGFINGEISILIPLTLGFKEWRSLKPKTLQKEIETITHMPDQQHLKRFVNEHSILIHTQHTNDDDRPLLEHSIPRWLYDFTFDPNRSRSLYSTSLVTSKCQQAIEAFVAGDSDSCPLLFFLQYDEISNASRLLEHAKSGSDSDDLLLFLRYLSKIHWLDMYTRGGEERALTNEITQWVCTTLVSRFLPT